MITHRLKMNDSKTEFLIIGSRQQLSKVSIDSITIGSSSVQPVSSVRNLGAWFDENLSMTTHVGKVCSKAFRGLYSIKQIRKYLSEEATKVLIHAFVTSHLDYCNSLLCGIPQYQYSRLQRILNAAARLVCLVPKFNHITPVLYDLHWLPVFYRVQYKIILLVHRSLFGAAPAYLKNLLKFKNSTSYSLRSNDNFELQVPRTCCKSFGDRAFAHAGPSLWNDLPSHLRNIPDVTAFKRQLKTLLFRFISY